MGYKVKLAQQQVLCWRTTALSLFSLRPSSPFVTPSPRSFSRLTLVLACAPHCCVTLPHSPCSFHASALDRACMWLGIRRCWRCSRVGAGCSRQSPIVVQRHGLVRIVSMLLNSPHSSTGPLNPGITKRLRPGTCMHSQATPVLNDEPIGMIRYDNVAPPLRVRGNDQGKQGKRRARAMRRGGPQEGRGFYTLRSGQEKPLVWARDP